MVKILVMIIMAVIHCPEEWQRKKNERNVIRIRSFPKGRAAFVNISLQKRAFDFLFVLLSFLDSFVLFHQFHVFAS